MASLSSKKRKQPSDTPIQGTCSLPGCIKGRFVDAKDNAKVFDFCCKSHAEKAKYRRILPPAEADIFCTWAGDNWKLSLLLKTHEKYKGIADQFKSKWQKPGTPMIERIYKIDIPQQKQDKFNHYQARVGGKQVRRFHGTSLSPNCFMGIKQNEAPCRREDCAMCQICKHGFLLKFAGSKTSTFRYGVGLYFSSISGKSNDYASGSEKAIYNKVYRVMFLCLVAEGRKPFITKSMDLPGLPKNHTSVIGLPSPGYLNYDETVVYSEDAASPYAMIVYSLS